MATVAPSTAAHSNPGGSTKPDRPRTPVAREPGRPRVRITGRAALLLVVVLIVLSFSISPLRAYRAQRARIAELERNTQVLVKANGDLERRIAELHSPQDLERLARECLGMVKGDQIAFVTVPVGGGPPSADC